MTASSSVLEERAPERSDAPFLRLETARRLCIDLISAEQERLIREGRLSPRQRIEVHLAGCAPGAEGDVAIGEDALGFDSLMLLDLVGTVSGYFCLGDSGAEDLLLVHRRLEDWARIVVAHFARVGARARIGFETSGSTGRPKRIIHPAARLIEEIEDIRRHILGPAGEPGRILSAVPPRHIYGFLWSVLLPQSTGIPALDFHRSAGEAQFRVCRPGDVVIGTPFIWERAARVAAALPPGVIGITSAAPSDEGTWRAAAALGLARFVEIYGSTETGGIGWRDVWAEPFRLSRRFEFHADGLRWRSTGETVALQDRLGWREDGTFAVLGRTDDVVQVAGVNVSLGRVEAVLRAVEGIDEVAVRLDGKRIKALVVAAPGLDPVLLEERLRAHASRELPAAARPDRFRFDTDLPRTPLGKLADW